MHFFYLLLCFFNWKTLCKIVWMSNSDHWATEPHSQPVIFSPCLIRYVPDSARNHAGTDETVPLLLAAWALIHTGHQMSQGRKKHMARLGLKPRISHIPVAQWSEGLHGMREVLGLNPGRAMCFFLPCDIPPLWHLVAQCGSVLGLRAAKGLSRRFRHGSEQGTNLIKQGKIVTGRPWEILGSSPGRAMCFSPPTLATKCHRGGKSTWPDPGPLAYRASTLTNELPSHTVDL